MVQRRLHQRFELVAGIAGEEFRRDRATVDADADGAAGVARDCRQPADFVLDRLVTFDVMQVARVVADLIDVRADALRQTIVFLQVDGQRGGGLPANGFQRLDLLVVVDGDADDRRTGTLQLLDLCDGRVDITGLGRAHALYGHRHPRAEGHCADAHRVRRLSRNRRFHSSIEASRQ
jgi:hypothetical protein